jgi:DNA-binding transcriptional MerR regulator
MNKLENHEGFWGPAEELIERAKCLQKVANVNLKTITVRLVRYYSTEGLIDKPDRLGREAMYHYKHLLQLVLARKLADHGAMLADIKQLMGGLNETELELTLRGPVEKLLNEMKHRRSLAMAKQAEESLEPSLHENKEIQIDRYEFDQLTYQIKNFGELLETALQGIRAGFERESEGKGRIEEALYLLREDTNKTDSILPFVQMFSEQLLALKEWHLKDTQLNQEVMRIHEQKIEHLVSRLGDRIGCLEGKICSLENVLLSTKK